MHHKAKANLPRVMRLKERHGVCVVFPPVNEMGDLTSILPVLRRSSERESVLIGPQGYSLHVTTVSTDISGRVHAYQCAGFLCSFMTHMHADFQKVISFCGGSSSEHYVPILLAKSSVTKSLIVVYNLLLIILSQ